MPTFLFRHTDEGTNKPRLSRKIWKIGFNHTPHNWSWEN